MVKNNYLKTLVSLKPNFVSLVIELVRFDISVRQQGNRHSLCTRLQGCQYLLCDNDLILLKFDTCLLFLLRSRLPLVSTVNFTAISELYKLESQIRRMLVCTPSN